MRADAYFKSLTPFHACLVSNRETGYAKPYSPINKPRLVSFGRVDQVSGRPLNEVPLSHVKLLVRMKKFPPANKHNPKAKSLLMVQGQKISKLGKPTSTVTGTTGGGKLT